MTPSLQSVWIDAHVHLYPRTPVLEALNAAAANFAAASGSARGSGFLLLSESRGHDVFKTLSKWAATSSHGLRPCGDPEAVVCKIGDWTLYIVAGRQVVTAPRIEVLTLGTLKTLEDGLDLDVTLSKALANEAIVVLPWGVGKWTGARRRQVARALQHSGRRPIYLGDIAGRPTLWPDPLLSTSSGHASLFSGTDPYPIAGAWRQIGAFGTRCEMLLDGDRPLSSLRAQLDARPGLGGTFGRRSGFWRLFCDQLRMRVGSELA